MTKFALELLPDRLLSSPIRNKRHSLRVSTIVYAHVPLDRGDAAIVVARGRLKPGPERSR